MYTKSIEVNPPEKQTYENGANFFSPLGQYSLKSQKRKAPVSVESRKGGRNKKCDILGCWPRRCRQIDQSTGRNVQDDLNLHQHHCENFTDCCPETSARNCQSTLRKIPPKSAYLIYTVLKPKIMQLWKCCVFCSQHAKRMRRLRLAGCFLCCVVQVYAGHFRYKKIIPQQVKGKKK